MVKKTKGEKVQYYLKNYKEMTYAQMKKPMGYKSSEGLRTWCKRNKMPNKRINSQSLRSETPLCDLVARAIKSKKLSTIELADRFNVPPKKIYEAMNELKKKHIVIDNFENGFVQLSRAIKPVEEPMVIDIHKHKEKEFCIGVTADNHIGSKYERLDVLNALYDRFADYGVKTVYNCGNYIDGECRFNKFDIYVHGVKAQVKNFIEKYPQRDGIKTYYISGDDHEGWYVQREHIDIGQVVEDEAKRAGRNDLISLGYMERDIVYKRSKGQSTIRVIHAGGGSSYAISYTTQKYAESLQGGEKPAMVLVGHYHKFDFGYPREIYMIQPGCTEDQTPFMRKRKLQAMVGGCVVWIKQNDLGIFTSVKIEWIPFYDKKFFEYKW